MEILVFTLGGCFYGSLETVFRGYTHWSMIITGGAIVLTFYCLLPFLNSTNVFKAALYGASIITLYEFFTGVIVNLWLKLNVWDYSQNLFNLFGQICPFFSFLWFLICLAFFSLIKYNKSIFF